MALAGTRLLRSQGLVSVHAHRTEGVTGSEGREGAKEPGAGMGAGTRTWEEANEGTQDRSGDGAGAGTPRGRAHDENGDGSGEGNESSNGDGIEDGIGEGGRVVKNWKKPHKSFRPDVGNGGGLGGRRKKRSRKGWFGSCRPRKSRE